VQVSSLCSSRTSTTRQPGTSASSPQPQWVTYGEETGFLKLCYDWCGGGPWAVRSACYRDGGAAYASSNTSTAEAIAFFRAHIFGRAAGSNSVCSDCSRPLARPAVGESHWLAALCYIFLYAVSLLVVMSTRHCPPLVFCLSYTSAAAAAAWCAACSVCRFGACGGALVPCVLLVGTAPLALRCSFSDPSSWTSCTVTDHPAAGPCLAVLRARAAPVRMSSCPLFGRAAHLLARFS
jgi:hypothetical protein